MEFQVFLIIEFLGILVSINQIEIWFYVKMTRETEKGWKFKNN